MTTDIDKAYEFANFRIALMNQKHLLEVQTEERLNCYINGGIFKAEPGFIAFIGDLINSGHSKLPILDVNDTPVMIDDLQEFKNFLLSSYIEVVYDYWNDWIKIKDEKDLEKLADV